MQCAKLMLIVFTNQSFDSLIPSLKFRRFEALMAVLILRQNVKIS